MSQCGESSPVPRRDTAQRSVICSSFSGYLAPCTVIFEVASSMLRRSSGVSLTETAPMFSSKRCNFVVPGIGIGCDPSTKERRSPSEIEVGGDAQNEAFIDDDAIGKEVLLGCDAIAISTTRCIICLLRLNCRLSAKFWKHPRRNRTLAFASILTPPSLAQ